MQDAPETMIRNALVPLERGGSSVARRAAPLAGFIAQLLACRGGVPAYRARRRAEPEAAAACYGASRTVSSRHFERWL